MGRKVFKRQKFTADRQAEFLARLRAGESLISAAVTASEAANSGPGALSTFVQRAELDERFALALAQALVLGKEARAAQAQEEKKR